MRTTGSLALLFGFGSLLACGSDTKVNQTANGVFPSEGFIGATVRVEVTGDQTNWSDSTTLDFGSGITVGTISVASTDDLIADITIDGSAALGTNDVTVTDGSKTFTLSKAFSIVSPVALEFQGDVSQGGLPFFSIHNIDLTHPFDATTDANGAFTNETITSPAGVDLEISSVTDFTISGRAFIDTTATPGDVTLDSGAGSGALTLDLGTVNVAAPVRRSLSRPARTPAA